MQVPDQSNQLANPPSNMNPGIRPKDDLELMIYHEKFPQLIAAAHRVKQFHAILDEEKKNGNGNPKRTTNIPPPISPDMVASAVSRIQNQFAGVVKQAVLRPGQSPSIDLIINDCIETLLDELAKCEQRHPIPPAKSLSKKKKKSTGKKAIAIKYDKWQTDILMQWMIDNKERPFPDTDEITKLMKLTNLSNSQVVNWATNVRKRNRKATLEGSKEPHHFIDFLFLAHENYLSGRNDAATPQVSESDDNECEGDDISPCSPVSACVVPEPKPCPVTSSNSNSNSGPNTVSPLTDNESHCIVSEPIPLLPKAEMGDDLGSDVELDFDPLSIDKCEDDLMLEEFADNWLHKAESCDQRNKRSRISQDDGDTLEWFVI